jgi:hypothetical protein
MKICSECKKENYEKDIIHGRKCRNCRKKYLKEKSVKNYSKNCLCCGILFHKQNNVKECSLKCYLFNRIEKKENCWLWKKQLNIWGYGKCQWKKKNMIAHRASFICFKGEIPNNLQVLHSCRNRNCINPDHLRLGTTKENMQDRSKDLSLSGEKNGNAILTNEQAKEIKKLLKENYHPPEIAKKFNVKPYVIYFIKNGKTWKHI